MMITPKSCRGEDLYTLRVARANMCSVPSDFPILEDELWRAVRSRRFDDLRQLLSARFLFVDNGEVATATELIASFDTVTLEEFALSEMVLTRPANSVAVVTYRLSERIRQGLVPAERQNVATSIWIRKDDFWLLEVHHETTFEH